jgi:hypothetical protein
MAQRRNPITAALGRVKTAMAGVDQKMTQRMPKDYQNMIRRKPKEKP